VDVSVRVHRGKPLEDAWQGDREGTVVASHGVPDAAVKYVNKGEKERVRGKSGVWRT
jgi:hypothetical protein